MKKLIRVYKYGIHHGEEKQVSGNEASGMIYLSGCHLNCDFCYTPETSKEKLGDDYTPEGFLEVLSTLVEKGAKNINLISPTHLWEILREVLTSFKRSFPDIPVILKTSGFQSEKIAKQMSELADVIVMDFKVLSKDVARANNLPENYGEIAQKQFAYLTNHKKFEYDENQKIKKGFLVRHLVLPKHVDDTKGIIQTLNEIGEKTIINLMTIFIDPHTQKTAKLDKNITDELISLFNHEKLQLIVNGKTIR